MNKLLLKLTLLSYFINAIFIHGQDQGYSPMPLAGSNAVNINTGTPNVSIPLWTLEGRVLKVPIAATYSSKGLGVNQSPGLIGTNWELIAGGVIIQETYGADDLFPNGFKTNGYKVNNLTDAYLSDVAKNIMDGEPDIFSFMIPGSSGQFVFKNSGEIMPLMKTNYKIEYLNGSFVIIDDLGNIYLFNLKETTKFYVSDDYENYSHKNNTYKWLLTRIISANKVDTISFEYQTKYFSSGTIGVYNYFGIADNLGPFSGDYTYYKFDTQRQNLKKISCNNGSIVFNYMDEQDTSHVLLLKKEFEDGDIITVNVPDPAPLATNATNTIKSVSILDFTDKLIKSYNFDYIYPNNRVMLSTITEQSALNEKLPPYQFYYINKSDIPRIDEDFHSDYGGFPGKKFISNFQSSAKPSDYFYKMPHLNAKTGILYEVYYPSGSYLHFDYEQNTYAMINGTEWFDSRWNNILYAWIDRNHIPAPGQRVKRLIQNDGTSSYSTEYEYLGADGKSSGRSTDYPITEYSMQLRYRNDQGQIDTAVFVTKSSNLMNLYSPDVFYERVIIYHGGKLEGTNKGIKGKTINEFIVEPSKRQANSNFCFPLLVSADREHCLFKSGFIFDQNDSLKSSTINKYSYISTGNSSSGIKVVQKDLVVPAYTYEIYTLNQRYTRLDTSIHITYDDNRTLSQNTTTYQYSRDGFTSLYPLVIKTLDSRDEILEKHIDYPHKDLSQGPEFKVFAQMALTYNIHALPIRQEIRKNNLIISGTKTNFNDASGTIPFLPKSISVIENGSYIEKTFFDTYNQFGMLTQSHGTDSVYSSFIYSYNHSLPVAEVINARVSEIFYTSFEDTTLSGINTDEAKTGVKSFNGTFSKTLPPGNYLLSYWKKNGNDWEYVENTNTTGIFQINQGLIDEVRIHPLNAMMTTKTWQPLVGISSATDLNGRSTYHTYDAFGRLSKQFDQDKTELSHKEYLLSSIFGKYAYPIDGDENMFTSCHQTLSPQLTVEGDNQVSGWQWFDDYCNGNLVAGSANYDAYLDGEVYFDAFTPENPSISKTYYVKPIVNGKCLPCEEKRIIYKPPIFDLGINPARFFTYNQLIDTIIPSNYTGCDNNWNVTVLNPGSWVSAYNNNGQLKISLQKNTTSLSRTETIRLNTPNNLLSQDFNIHQGPYLTLNLAGTLGTYNATIVATPTGGQAPYTYQWYVDGVLRTETGNSIVLNKGRTYLVKCIITDNYTRKQTAIKEISYSAVAPLVLSKTVNYVKGKINMSVTVSGGTPGYTYEWWDNDVILSGKTSNFISIPYVAGQIYCCKVSDSTPGGSINAWICNGDSGGPMSVQPVTETE